MEGDAVASAARRKDDTHRSARELDGACAYQWTPDLLRRSELLRSLLAYDKPLVLVIAGDSGCRLHDLPGTHHKIVFANDAAPPDSSSSLWFPEGLVSWSLHSGPWVYENFSADAAPAAPKKEEKKKKKPKKEMAFIKFSLTCSPSDDYKPLYEKIKARASEVPSLTISESFQMVPLAFGIHNMELSFTFDVNGSCFGTPIPIHQVENWMDTFVGEDKGYEIQAKEQVGYDGPGL